MSVGNDDFITVFEFIQLTFAISPIGELLDLTLHIHYLILYADLSLLMGKKSEAHISVMRNPESNWKKLGPGCIWHQSQCFSEINGDSSPSREIDHLFFSLLQKGMWVLIVNFLNVTSRVNNIVEGLCTFFFSKLKLTFLQEVNWTHTTSAWIY